MTDPGTGVGVKVAVGTTRVGTEVGREGVSVTSGSPTAASTIGVIVGRGRGVGRGTKLPQARVTSASTTKGRPARRRLAKGLQNSEALTHYGGEVLIFSWDGPIMGHASGHGCSRHSAAAVVTDGRWRVYHDPGALTTWHPLRPGDDSYLLNIGEGTSCACPQGRPHRRCN